MSRLRLRAAALLPVLAVLVAGCVRLPEEGPVRNIPGEEQTAGDSAVPFAPRPPQRGELPHEIVQHFFEAMMAVPVQTATAELFLTEEAREEWDPSRRIVTYAGSLSPRGRVAVEVRLPDAQWLDARGVWRGELPEDERDLSLRLSLQDGEWRISEVPDALVVHSSWFAEQYRQVSLFFFDPSAEILVPEPVFVPSSTQLPTVLVRGLLQGPPADAGEAVTSFFPRGSGLADVSVPVTDEGIAEVALDGELGTADPETLELMAAQLTWTLRQDPSVEGVRVTIGGTPVTLPGGTTTVPASFGSAYDPEGIASTELHGLERGRLVVVDAGEVHAVDGPLGTGGGLRDVAVDATGATAAAVSQDGTRLLVGPVEADPERVLTAPIARAADLGTPSWDALGRLWVADRRPEGAVVWAVADGRARRVHVPGVTGARVVDLQVSRDGTRLVAALDRPGGDAVVAGRVTWATRGVRADRIHEIESGDGRPLTVRDLGWRSPTEVLVLSSLGRRLSEVRRVSVDGSPATQRGVSASEVIRADCRRLVSSATPDTPAWAVTDSGGLVQLAPLVSAPDLPAGLQLLAYPG